MQQAQIQNQTSQNSPIRVNTNNTLHSSKRLQFKKYIKNEQLQKYRKSQRFRNIFKLKFMGHDSEQQQNQYNQNQNAVVDQEIVQNLIKQQNVQELTKIIDQLICSQIQQIFFDTNLFEKIYDLVSKNITKVENILLVNKLVKAYAYFIQLMLDKKGLIKRIVKQTNNLKDGSRAQQLYLDTIWSIISGSYSFQNHQRIQQIIPNAMYLVQNVSVNSLYWTKIVNFLSTYIDSNFQFSTELISKIIDKYKQLTKEKCIQKCQIYLTIQNIIFKQARLQIFMLQDFATIIVQSKKNLELQSKDHKNWNHVLSTLIEKSYYNQITLSVEETKQLKNKNIKKHTQNSYIRQFIQWLLVEHSHLFEHQMSLQFLYFVYQVSKHGQASVIGEYYKKYELFQFLIDCLKCDNLQMVFLSLQALKFFLTQLPNNEYGSFQFFQHLKQRQIQDVLESIMYDHSNKKIYQIAEQILFILENGNNMGTY